MDYVSKGNSCHSASIKFEVASNTARNGYKRYPLEGHDVSRKVGGKKRRIREQEVATYVKNNPDFILSEMGKHFGISGPGALYYWLRKLGYSYKKKLHLC